MPLALASYSPKAQPEPARKPSPDRRPDGEPRPAAGDKTVSTAAVETELDRILKLIPTEVVAIYTAAVPIAPEVPGEYFLFALFIAGIVAVSLILYADGKATGQPARWPQYVARTLAFVTWALAVAWPIPWIDPGEARWAVALAVVIVPIVGERLLRERPPTPPS